MSSTFAPDQESGFAVPVESTGPVQHVRTRSSSYEFLTRIVKLGGSLVFFCATEIWRTISRVFGRPGPGTLVVLCYHAVPDRQRRKFARQMDLLLKCATPVSLESDIQLKPGRRLVAVTFDDAYQSTLRNAIPELEARKIPCTIFAVSHMAGQTPSWAGTKGYDRDDRFASEQQLAALSGELVTIGSHTMTHPDLREVASNSLRRELVESREVLERTLNRDVSLLAFPHGSYDDEIVRACRDAGYQQTFSIEPMTACNSEYVMGRMTIDLWDWAIEFHLKFLGAYRWLRVIYRGKQRVLSVLASN